ncbi:MAG TPA: hypothetical protein DCY72_00525 [Ruminococcaceae bacterium]|nr:hypothetical protein [Oscillospiraceae bacterium]
MNNDKQRRDVAPEDEYTPNPTKLLAPFLSGVAAALAGDTAMYFNWIAFAFLCYVILAVSIVWIVKAELRKGRAEYHMWRRLSDALNQVEKFEGRLDTLETNLDLKADKPARSNIRPGSVQSDRYKEMTGGEN